MNHIMLDLETFGTVAGSAIASIGAARFDATGVKETFYVNVDIRSCEAHGLTFDADTIAWWMRQDEGARIALTINQVSLTTALESFAAWAGKPDCVWGNGAGFDNVVIAAAFRACGMKTPWRHFQDRCYRTIASLCPDLERAQVGTHHKASDDAFSQVIHLLDCCKKLNLLSVLFETGETK